VATSLPGQGAIAIDKYFKGDSSPVQIYDLKREGIKEMAPEKVSSEANEWEAKHRLEVPVLPAQNRKHSFQEIEQCFREEQAREEAARCLRCDLET
jgi:NADH-quinone oxidoreductase subunit F